MYVPVEQARPELEHRVRRSEGDREGSWLAVDENTLKHINGQSTWRGDRLVYLLMGRGLPEGRGRLRGRRRWVGWRARQEDLLIGRGSSASV